jgi:hypothetical protein
MKSVEKKFAEACEALRKAKKFKRFEEKQRILKETVPHPAVEVLLNMADAVLAEEGIVRESTPIKKHNGVADNGRGGFEVFTESANSFSEGYVTTKRNLFAKGDKALFNVMESEGRITSEQKRTLLGEQPSEYDNLTEQQKKDFAFARAIGLSESDAFKVVRMPHGVRK